MKSRYKNSFVFLSILLIIVSYVVYSLNKNKIDVISYSDVVEEGFIGHIMWESLGESEIFYGYDKNNLTNKKELIRNDYNGYTILITPNPDKEIPEADEKTFYFKIHSITNDKDYYSDIYSINILTHEEVYAKTSGTQLDTLQEDTYIFIDEINIGMLSDSITKQANIINF